MPDEPVWNGRGFDPWLPQRLRDATYIARYERQLYRSFFGRLAEFLVSVTRAVLSSTIPEIGNARGLVPEWSRQMSEFVRQDVRNVVAHAYRVLLGDDYNFEARPAVAAYLAMVDNRMVNTSNEVFDSIAATVARGNEEGWSIPRTAAAIDETLDATETPKWRNRATVVARTETLASLNAGRTDAFRATAEFLADDDELDEPLEFERIWLATLDNRVRDTHRVADGQRVALDRPFMVGGFPLDHPGDPNGPPQETIQCRCTTIIVERGEDVDLSERQFLGVTDSDD